MKAIVCDKYGPPDVLRLAEIPKPAPKDGEILIKVRATTVNRTDTAMLRAKPFFARLITGVLKPANPVLGTEFSGEVETVGKNVASFKAGDKVFGFEELGFGSHAQYKTMPENSGMAVMPESITFEEAAPSLEGAHYALNFINKVEVKEGQKVLVNGATGAIGSALVQLLRYFGADITAVCGSNNMELVKKLGAGRVIDYTQEDFTKDAQKYDFVFDAVGKSSFSECKPLLSPGGVYISSELGHMAQNIFFAVTTPLFGGRKVIFPMPQDLHGSVRFIKKLIEEGKYKAVIDRKYPLERIVEAYKYVETGEKTGNVVITMEHE